MKLILPEWMFSVTGCLMSPNDPSETFELKQLGNRPWSEDQTALFCRACRIPGSSFGAPLAHQRAGGMDVLHLRCRF
ncbi:hypothetical protein [Stenotrophomonas maltophilia]|uniref:Uncharacterized protein n=1 Tax=Stenotrophomonas maltophilia TaxID=40324 RepID=A0AAI9C657_STEMA|nr:hypothetical protein [Stenotrophomonas maltophilia]EKT4094700.1 hypothetical protein [Stenotrophomonas maltophilia]UUS15288.1 hypothetical protein NMB32_05395 [Stenotrophomonas sp. CD2]HEL4102246.1 hypothetical protein [Stenotrophomonas maltophilia]HEL5043684.1 hypothetical protein [Stenotrophomonas maltophilia]